VRFAPHGDAYSLDAFEKRLLETKPDLVFFEAISNPMLIVADGDDAINIAKKHGVRVIIDNTFATPLLWKPLAAGADLVIHSVTKYLSGHGNLSAGVVSGNDPEIAKAAIEYRKLVGHMLSPDDAYRLSDMLKTFALRFQKHCHNASVIAKYLNKHPLIEKVLYPGLETHPTHGQALKLFRAKGFGAIVTFDIKGVNQKEKALRCDSFINLIAEHIPLVPTLGDADTILMPVEPVWGDKYPFPGMIRLSLGIEDQKDLLQILGTTLAAIT
jgi:cystathionine beta-lyase/cystathionine gamma-synthase